MTVLARRVTSTNFRRCRIYPMRQRILPRFACFRWLIQRRSRRKVRTRMAGKRQRRLATTAPLTKAKLIQTKLIQTRLIQTRRISRQGKTPAGRRRARRRRHRRGIRWKRRLPVVLWSGTDHCIGRRIGTAECASCLASRAHAPGRSAGSELCPAADSSSGKQRGHSIELEIADSFLDSGRQRRHAGRGRDVID